MSKDKWIPCSDKLPKNSQWCLVTVKHMVGDQEYFDVDLLMFIDGEIEYGDPDEWEFRNMDSYVNYGYGEAIAWMPFEWPDPYKEEGGETCTT